MLDNKVLVNLYCLSLGKNFEVYLPINEKVGNITKILNSNFSEEINENKYVLINVDTSNVYKNNDLIKNTDIRNGTKLILK